MHASYVTKILPCTKFENQVVTKAEEFIRFQLGFDFLNTQKSSSVKESQNKARFSELTEAERNRLLRVETQNKVYEQLDKLGSKRFQRYGNLGGHKMHEEFTILQIS